MIDVHVIEHRNEFNENPQQVNDNILNSICDAMDIEISLRDLLTSWQDDYDNQTMHSNNDPNSVNQNLSLKLLFDYYISYIYALFCILTNSKFLLSSINSLTYVLS